MKSFEKAAQLKPRSAEAQYNIGAAYMNMEKVDQAIAFFKKALEIYPGHTMARTLLKELESYQSE